MPCKQKATAEEKTRVAQECLSGRMTRSEAASLLQVNRTTIDEWIYQYESEGSSAFSPRKRNRVYTAELKTRAVISYLNGEGSLMDICRKYAIHDTHQLRNWIKVYNAHGDFNSRKHSGGGSYMSKARSTTQEERLQIVQECLALDKNYGEIAKKYNVSYQQVRTWTLHYIELGESGLEDRRGKRKKDQTPRTELEKAQIEIEKLKHQLRMAEMERDLLKKLNELERW
ncbi:helix-turn-helix domain-containing protein [Selenomonas sp. KH1T6]|uniref:helix-turn-helix domain-containing protein n=3 Tax=Selenomonas sp. KH1T6 TaxID=3158784 RepID=UPI000943BAC1